MYYIFECVMFCVGFLDDNRGESRDPDKEYDMGSRDLIGDGLTPPDTEINSDDDGESPVVVLNCSHTLQYSYWWLGDMLFCFNT